MSVSIGDIVGSIRLQDEFTSKLAFASKNLGSFSNSISSLTSRLDSSIQRSSKYIVGLGVAVAGVIGKQMFDAISESEAALAQLEARIKSTGATAGYQADQLVRMADRLSAATGIDDELFQKAQAAMLRFEDVRGSIFERALRDSADLAVAMGTDVTSAVELLARTLQEPDEKLTQIQRSIGAFSDAEERAIKTAAKMGDEVKAQSLLLDILERRVGGAANAFRNTLPGAIQATRTEWENLLETVGQSHTGSFKVAIEGMVSLLTWLRENWNVLESAVFETLADISDGLSKAVDAWLKTIGRLVRAFAAFSDLNPFIPDSDIEKLRNTVKFMEGVKDTLTDAAEGFRIKADEALDTDVAVGKVNALGRSLRQLTDEQLKALQASRDRIKELVEEVTRRERLFAAIKISTAAYKEETLTQKQGAMIDEIRNILLEQGLDLSRQQIALINESVGRIEKATEATAAWVAIREKLDQDITPLDMNFVVTINGQNPDEFLKEWAKIEQSNQDAFALQREQVQLELESQADYFRNSLVTPRQELERLQRYIDLLANSTDKYGNVLLSAAEAQQLTTQATSDFIDESLTGWGSFFSFLSQSFGGIFNEISRMISQIQSARQTGSQIGSMFSGIGAAAGAAAGVIVGVVLAVYDKMQRDTAKAKAHSFGSQIVLGKDAGSDWTVAVEDAARRATMQIRKTIEAFAEALGGVFTAFADMEVQVRRDGKYFRAFVEGEFIGSFIDMESAVEAAILAAFKRPETMLSGVSDLIREGMNAAIKEGLLDFGSLDELQEFLGRLKEITDIQLGPAVTQTLDTVRGLDRLWSAIERIGEATNAVTGAFGSLVMAEARTWQELFDSITGRQKTDKEIRAEKEAELKVAKAELEIRKATIAQRILQAKAEIAAYEAGNLFIGGIKSGGGGGNHGQGTSGGIIGIAVAMSKAAEVAGASIALLADTTTTATEKMIAALKAEVEGLEGLLAALGNLQIPEIGVGGGRGGGVDRGQIRDDLRDQIKQLEAQAKGPLHEALLSLQKGIEDFTKRAKEGKLPPAELAHAIDLMTKQFQQSVMEQARSYAGLGTDFTKRLGDMKKFFAELEELGRGKTGIPNWLREVLEGKALDRFGKELSQMIGEFNGLADPMLAITMRADELKQNVLAFAEAAGWSGEQIAEAMRAIDKGMEFQRQQGINSVLDRLFGYLKQAGLFEKEQREFEKQKALLDIQLIEAQLRFFGALDATTEEWIKAARDFVNSAAFGGDNANDIVRVQVVNPEDIYGTMIDAVRNAVNEFRSGIEEFAKSTQDLLTDEQLSGLTQQEQLAAAKSRFDTLLSAAQGGDVDALKQLTDARQEYLQELRQSEGAGFGFDVEWRRIMGASANLLANAQKSESDMIADILYHNEQTITAVMNTLSSELQTTLYDVARQISDAIYGAIGGVPGMASGGIVMRGPRLIRVAEMGVPEAIVPLDRLMRAVPYQVQGMGMGTGNGYGNGNGNGNGGSGSANVDNEYDSWYDHRARDSSQRLGAIEQSNAMMAREIRQLRQEMTRRR